MQDRPKTISIITASMLNQERSEKNSQYKYVKLIEKYMKSIADSQSFTHLIGVVICVNIFFLMFSQNPRLGAKSKYDFIGKEDMLNMMIVVLVFYWLEMLIIVMAHGLYVR